MKLLQAFEDKKPEIVFEWNDSETEAQGWIVINSLRGGAAGGGTRMRKGLDKNEVKSLAKTMEIKFSVCGPAIGGAKSGINFDPKDPRKAGVLNRWYKAAMPILKNYYGTGGDLNVDEIHEVIPITEKYGLKHPQEGVVNGHISPDEVIKKPIIKQLQDGVLLPLHNKIYTPAPEKNYVVADMITGFGVFEAVKHFYNHFQEDLSGKRAIIQGWGNVASAAALYLAQAGAKIVGIIDKPGGIIDENGLDYEQIKDLFLTKDGNKLAAKSMLSFEETNAKIWDLTCEIFIPAAASRLVLQNQVEKLIDNGLEVISCGANVPFADPEIFFGPIAKYVDENVALIPDFIANCGMARVFAYLMQKDTQMTENAIFEDTSQIILEALNDVFTKNNSRKNLTESAFEIALAKLEN